MVRMGIRVGIIGRRGGDNREKCMPMCIVMGISGDNGRNGQNGDRRDNGDKSGDNREKCQH
jgi:hypothetical protein